MVPASAKNLATSAWARSRTGTGDRALYSSLAARADAGSMSAPACPMTRYLSPRKEPADRVGLEPAREPGGNRQRRHRREHGGSGFPVGGEVILAADRVVPDTCWICPGGVDARRCCRIVVSHGRPPRVRHTELAYPTEDLMPGASQPVMSLPRPPVYLPPVDQPVCRQPA